MPLHYRRRGETSHIRGTVRIGRASIKVPKFSSGCRARSLAEAVGAEEEARIRPEALGGAAGRTDRLTIAHCIATYLGRPGGVAAYDEDRLADLNERIGAWALERAEDAWQSWLRERGSIYVADSKSGFSRTVPMHTRVRAALSGVWEGRKKPINGRVFLSQRGKPYTHTRDTGSGGNPLTKAHKTACAKAKIVGFRVHDWRHHFASWMVMRGADLYTLMKTGGWKSLRMVQRYAAVSDEHMTQAVAKLA